LSIANVGIFNHQAPVVMTAVKLKEMKHDKGALSLHVISVDPPWGCQDKQGEIWLVNTWEGGLAGKFQGVNGSLKKLVIRKWPLSHSHPMGSHLRNVYGNSVLQCLSQHELMICTEADSCGHEASGLLSQPIL